MSAILRLFAFGHLPKRAKVAAFLMLAMGAAMFASVAGHAASAIRPVTAKTLDDGDGFIDTVDVTFSGPMDPTKTPQVSSGPGVPGFRVSDYDIAEGGIAYVQGDPRTLRIRLVQRDVPDTDATPSVVYETGGGNATDLTGAEIDNWTAQNTALDGAGPVLMSASARDLGAANIFRVAGESLTLRFSEAARLTGASPADRWSNLERAIKLNPQPGGACVDGVGATTSFNFPQPVDSTKTPVDAIESPADATVATNAFRIVMHSPGNTAPPGANGIPAVPLGCKLGIDDRFTSMVTDAAGNAASGQSRTTHLVWVNPSEIELLSASTLDGAVSAANGRPDAVQVIFDQNIDDSTIQSNLAQFSIAFGDDAVTVDTSASDTGANENDNVFVVRFTVPAGVTLDGGDKAQISHAQPAGCTGSGLKGNVPTPGYQACVASFDVEATDGVLPLLTAASTLDIDSDGLLDRLELTFSEPMVTGGAAGWKVDGRNATAFAVDTADNHKATLDFLEGTAGDTGLLPSITYTHQTGSAAVVDFGANEPKDLTTQANTDGAAPAIFTTTVLDANGDGTVDQAAVKFSENLIDPAASAASAFSVGGNTATGFVAGTANDDTLTVAVAPIDGTEPKAVAYAATGDAIEDAAHNTAVAKSFDIDAVTDGAKPIGTVTISQGAPMNAGEKTVVVTYTEPMSTTAAPAATFNGDAARVTPVADTEHTAGWINAEPNKWEGALTIAAGDCAISTGCPATVTADGAADEGGNTQLQAASLTTEIDTMAPAPATLGAFAATVATGESVPASTVNMFTGGFSLGSTFVSGDAAGGASEILVDGVALDPAAKSNEIGASDSSATAQSAFADHDALATAIAEGARVLSIRLCDDAANCSTSIETLSITADYTPVNVALSAPGGGNVVAGGSTLGVAWDGDDAGAGFDHVELDYSTNDGGSYVDAISHDRTLDGTFDWSVPSIDAAKAKVRAATVDASGNKAYGESAAFSIDSSAPVVRITSPSASNPFVPAGGTATVRWNVSDASIEQATDPIKIESSVNGGSTWSEINDGTYSHANDGEESWNVPAGASFSTLLRVTATDATGKATTVKSTKIAKGVGGYVADKYGSVVAFGTANADTHETAVPKGYAVRGIAVRPDHSAGYVVLHQGAVYPFAVGDNAKPAKPAYTKFSGDRARDIVLRTPTSGYVLASSGRLYGFGGAPKATVSAVWSSDLARDVVMLANGRGGYVLDAYGRMFRFRVGSYSMPPRIATTKLSTARAVSVAMRSNGKSGWVLDSSGRLYRFGGAPSRTTTGVSSRAYAKSILLVAQDSGYWVDGRGRFHAFGSAFGNPTRTTLGTNRARGAAM